MSDQVWVSDALSENGKHYYVIWYLLPVLPIGIVAFIWYILFRNGQAPLPITAIVALVSLVFLHQEVEIIRFIRVAARTAKKIVINENGAVSIHLFNDKVITSKNFTVVNNLPEPLRNNIYRRLFPKDKHNATIIYDDKNYYLTGTLEDYELMFDQLEKLSR